MSVEEDGAVNSPEITPSGSGAESASTDVRTFLIADVRGYTEFTQESGDEAAALLAGKFASVTREVSEARGGNLVELRGDEALVVFSSARQALRAAIDLQTRYLAESEKEPDLPLNVGIGLDSGEGVRVEAGYRGSALNLAARLCTLAGPGDVLTSEAVTHLARKLPEMEYIERGEMELKGFSEPVRVVQIMASGPSGRSADLPSRAQRARPVEHALPVGGFLGAMPEGTLVAREAELHRLLKALAAVESGLGRLVLLSGEPGIGKTRLAQEVALEARRHSFLVATASCFEQRQAVPYAPFVELFSTLYDAASPSMRAEIPRRWPSLARLLDDRSVPLRVHNGDGQEEQERLFRAVADVLRTVSDTKPVAIMVDDLQWADASSLQMLERLTYETRSSRVLIVATYRDTEIDREHPLGSLMVGLGNRHLIDEIPLHRLTREGTAQLAASTIGEAQVADRVADLIYERTEGNPFFLQELVQALLDQGLIGGSDDVAASVGMLVPTRVRAVIGQRVSRLSPIAQGVLGEAAVLGQSFAFDTLQEIGQRSETDVEAALEQADAIGLIREAGRDEYVFNHALTRQALYVDLPSRRRRRLHLAAAEALEKLPRPARERRSSELAFHFLEGGDVERALQWAMLAGDQAEATFAHAEAERLYRAALEMAWDRSAETLLGGSQEAQILEKLGGVLQTVGRYDEALEALDRAAQSYQEIGDIEGECRAVARVGTLHGYMGQVDEGLARLEPFLAPDRKERRTAPNLATMYVTQSQLLFAKREYSASLAAATQASELASNDSESGPRAEAEVRKGEALAMLGRHSEARRVLENAIPLAEEGNASTLIRALAGLGTTTLLAGDGKQARLYEERALRLADTVGDPRAIAIAGLAMSQVLIILGTWSRADELLDRVLSLTGSGLAPFSDVVLAAQARLRLWQGDSDDATRILDDLMARAERNQDVQLLLLCSRALAEKELRDGTPGAAATRLESLLQGEHSGAPTDVDVLLLLARAEIAQGNETRAEELVGRALTHTTPARNRLGFGLALWVLGMVRSEQRRWDESHRLFEAALTVAREIPYPYHEARILVEWGIMLTRKGETGVAREKPLRDALAIFADLGAMADVEQTERVLGHATD